MHFKVEIIKYLFELKYARWVYKNNLEKLRIKRWNDLNSILRKSPFYSKLAFKNSKLEDYPIIDKSIFMSHFDKINTQKICKKVAYDLAIQAENSRDFSPMINQVTIGLSSGTSGNRGVFLASEKERAQWVAGVLDRVIGFSLRKRKVAFFLRANSNLYDSVKSSVLSFYFLDLLRPTEEHIENLNKIQPTVLVAQPSMLLELAKAIEEGLLSISPEKVISVAEVLCPEDSIYLRRIFKQIIHQVYQCTEGFLASTCEKGTLHFNEDFLIIEKKYIDEERVRFHPIITDLKRSSQPVIRYELNDIIHEKFNCSCGSKMTGIEQIEGRADDVLFFQNEAKAEIRIYPDFFRRAIILSDETILDYALIQKSEDLISLYIDGTEESFRKAKNGVLELLSLKEIKNVSVERIDTRQVEKGNKLRRIRNDYRKRN